MGPILSPYSGVTAQADELRLAGGRTVSQLLDGDAHVLMRLCAERAADAGCLAQIRHLGEHSRGLNFCVPHELT